MAAFVEGVVRGLCGDFGGGVRGESGRGGGGTGGEGLGVKCGDGVVAHLTAGLVLLGGMCQFMEHGRSDGKWRTPVVVSGAVRGT